MQAARFISPKKSREPIGKVTGLISPHQGESLRRSLFVDDKVKTGNEAVYYAVDILHTAIQQQKTVMFKYIEYTPQMPRSVMYETLKRFNGGKRLPVYGETVFHPREKVILQKMADALGVSYTALVIRLRGLGMLNHHDISEYIEKELQLGGNTS